MISRDQASELLNLFFALKRASGWTNKQSYAPLDMSPTQVRLIEYISGNDGVSQTELARATDTDKALTGRLLQSLIERGWLRRGRSDEDARAYVVRLSPAGHDLMTHLEGIRAEVLDRLAQTLDPCDVTDFQRIVKKLLDTMQPAHSR
jgi:DNA-binding MarR family transcriptional regulator